MKYQIKSFYDQDTFTLTYVVFDSESKDAVVIDPVLNYDPAPSKTSYASVDEVLNFIESNSLKLHTILETHAHADHLSGAAAIKNKIPSAKIAIGQAIVQVQEVFVNFFNLKDFETNGSCFDVLLEDNQVYSAGSIDIKTISTPGHTPACCSFLIDDCVFTGDALFMPDFGTGRCDFPAGSAKDLYHSIHGKLYKLPDETRVFTGHDYQPGGRALAYESTIGTNKEENIHIKESTSEAEFVHMRNTRDANLKAPRLLIPSIQVNIAAGRLPTAEDNGSVYLKLPIRD